MDVLERFKRVLLRNVYSLFVVFFLIVMLSYLFTIIRNNLSNPLLFLVVFSIAVALLGQVLLIAPFSLSYHFYVFSYAWAISISVLIWLSYHISYPELFLAAHFAVVATLIAVPLAIHWLTKKRIGTSPMIPIFSIFLFGLLLVFSNTQTMSSTSYDMLFMLAIVLFVLTSIFGLNMAYRTMILNIELKIRDRNHYLIKTRENLLKKYPATDAQADVDLLIYYLSSSLDSFVYGDFDRSYMDAFKIIDNQGTAFKTIYTLPMNEEQWKHLKDIRNNLSHARITEGKKEEKEEKKLQKLKELKKGLFRETLDILKIVRFQFIDTALKNK